MGLMFARRRMEEAAKRAANKAKGQAERHSENKEKIKASKASEDGKSNGSDSKGTK